jgi:hypothetical protein
MKKIIFKLISKEERLNSRSNKYPFLMNKNMSRVPFIDEVEEFNEVMGKSWQNRTTPTIDPKDAQFVIDFITEELEELKEAVKEKDIVKIFDALLDITYVGLGNGALTIWISKIKLRGVMLKFRPPIYPKFVRISQRMLKKQLE